MKNVLITGCSRGLGAIIAAELISKECNVIAHCRDKRSVPGAIANVSGDITDIATYEKIDLVLQKYKIDTYVNNAAVHQRKAFLEHSDADICHIIDTNLISQIRLLRRVYEWFRQEEKGLIVNVNSIAGIQPAPNETVYSATKYGLKGFSQSLQVESIGTNVRIVDVFPGAMKTDMASGRDNFNQLIDPAEISQRICDVITSTALTSLETEVVIRKFIQK